MIIRELNHIRNIYLFCGSEALAPDTTKLAPQICLAQVAQIFLSSGVVAAGVLAVVFSTAWGSLQCQVPRTKEIKSTNL